MRAYSEKDISEALKRIDEEMQELSESKSLVERAGELELTEEMYHRLCRTPLSLTDSLGRVLGDKLGYTFRKRTSNHYVFTLPNGWRLLVPTYDGAFVKIEVDHYYTEQNYEAHYLEDSLRRTRDKIHDIETKFFGGDTSEKAKFLFSKRLHIPVMQKIAYYCNDLHKHYEKRFTQVLQDLKKAEAEDAARLHTANENHRVGKEKQEACLQEYSNSLLQWTNTIFVIQKGSTNINKTIKRE